MVEGTSGSTPPKLEEPQTDRTNYIKAALGWQYNWIGLAGAAAFALVSGSGLPLILAAGIELIYLSLVPQSSRFRRLVRSWQYMEEKRQQQAKLSDIFRQLPLEIRGRYNELSTQCRDILANYQRLSSTSRIYIGQMEERLNGLLNSYLRLQYAVGQHEEYLANFDSATIQGEIVQLEHSVQSPDSLEKVKGINQKRIEILKKRLEKFGKIRENREVIFAQCKAVEDVLGLIKDQSVTLRDPQEVSGQLYSLIHDVEETEKTVREVEAIFQIESPEALGLPPLPSTVTSTLGRLEDSRSRMKTR
jgi:hypothetical protein